MAIRTNVIISASCDSSVAIFTTSLDLTSLTLHSRILPHKSLEIFFHLHSTFARLYNAATSPASRLCSAGSLAIIIMNIINIILSLLLPRVTTNESYGKLLKYMYAWSRLQSIRHDYTGQEIHNLNTEKR